MRALVKTKLPGPKSTKILEKLRRLNVGYSDPYPFVHSKEGAGCYFKDIDGNIFLDFASQISSNPLGYNDKELRDVIKEYKNQPIKYAGQDFTVKEHLDLIEELISITPKGLNSAFLINSGAEAVENCMKLALRKQGNAKFGIAFNNSFHGRTMGALSATKSKPIHKQSFLSIPMKHFDFNENSLDEIEKTIRKNPKEVGFIIIEAVQGEGGYNIASNKLIKSLRKLTKEYHIPFIVDEVQSGMARTGKWWAIEHYNVLPDLMSAAKALQVGASIANIKYQPKPGSISSTWGGGHILDLAIGLETIRIIKRRKLLRNIKDMGDYLIKRLNEIPINIENVRGLGLMIAFDLPSKGMRDNLIIECLKNGLVLLGCGERTIRVIPPYIISEKEADEGIDIIEKSILKISNSNFKHKGKICNYLTCGEGVS